jgi:hypothetical protein|tara:strand:+ start:742 stop:1173 length:432 start_codon:yes stop_codon:yes gene_type:complete
MNHISIDILCKIIPEDVIRYIGDFIPLKKRLFLNKKCYEENQKFLWETCYKEYNNTLRKIVRNDYEYIFLHKLKNNYLKWKKLKNWIYKNKKFNNFNDYLRYLCIEYNSSKCKGKLNAYENKLGYLRKKKFKNIRTISRKWSS